LEVLQLTKKVPYPYHDGESWAVRSIAEGLNINGCTLHLLALNTDKHKTSEGAVSELRSSAVYKSVQTIDINTTGDWYSAIANILNGSSYHIQRYNQSAIHQKVLDCIEQIEKLEIIIFESLYVLPYLQSVKAAYPNLILVYRAHNVEYEIWQRITKEVSPLAQWYFRDQWKRLKRYEKQVLKLPSLIAAVSQRDQYELLKLERNINIISLPIGVCVNSRTDYQRDQSKLKIGFIGSLDWRPNIYGLNKFFKDIWPSISSSSIELHIAGRGSDSISAPEDNITIHGRVGSSEAFLKSMDLSIVPLWSGSGTRVKILEAMSYGVPVLSTSIGAEGIAYKHQSNILIANTHKEWTEALQLISSTPAKLDDISSSAIEIVKTDHNIDLLGKKLLDHITRIQTT